jgi:RsiW-degrading membrane proteinase PrsW (M82 family)
MALVELRCPCGKLLRANDSLIGQTIQCNLCRRELTVPDPKAIPPEPKQPKEEVVPAAANKSPREYLYWALALAIFPLAVFLAHPREEDLATRFRWALAKAPADVKHKIEQLQEVYDIPDEVLAFVLVEMLPSGRLDSRALLPRHTTWHWVFAAAAAGVVFVFSSCLFSPGMAKPGHLVAVALFTGTMGVAFDLILRDTKIFDLFLHFGSLPGENPVQGFLASWAGFTFGVGLVEEFSKLLPLLWFQHRKRKISWRLACLWGLASGAGFGVSEALFYSEYYYNGISSGFQYAVRFVSCVGAHAVLSASAGISLYHNQHLLNQAVAWYEKGVVLLRVLVIVMFLHGLYDCLLAQEILAPAFLVDAAAFLWLAWQIESTRKRELANVATVAATA